MDVQRAFPQALILMTRPYSLSRSNSSAHHRIIRTALLPEFGGMGIGATDFIRLLRRCNPGPKVADFVMHAGGYEARMISRRFLQLGSRRLS